MDIHPLFAGFTESSPYAVGAALGFAIHVETALGPLPATLDPLQRARMHEGGDLAGFHFAGGWGAPGAHCLMFAKPLTRVAAAWWHVAKPCINCYGWGFCVSVMGDELHCRCGASIQFDSPQSPVSVDDSSALMFVPGRGHVHG